MLEIWILRTRHLCTKTSQNFWSKCPVFWCFWILGSLDHSISDHLNTKQVKVCYSFKFAIQMFAIQIPTVVKLPQDVLKILLFELTNNNLMLNLANVQISPKVWEYLKYLGFSSLYSNVFKYCGDPNTGHFITRHLNSWYFNLQMVLVFK